jgi:branched-subunit amino acid ABC-type transport system permease component
VGGVLGFVYGTVVTGRMATWPRVTVTTFSLGVMLLAVGVVGTIWRGVFFRPPSPFGQGTHIVLDYGISVHQEVTVALVVVIMISMTWVLERTRFGVYIRAIADDAGAAEAVGVPVRRVSTIVWTFTGAVAAMGGALVVVMTQITELVVLFVLLRSLASAVLGGFDSLPLALAGAILFGAVESFLGGGVFGVVDSGLREILLMVILFGAILLMSRRRGGVRLTLQEA